MGKTTIRLSALISSDTTFRAAGKAISDALEAVGCIKTADTGQIDWATVTRPTGASTIAGYEIRQLPAGTLQTANPILIKVGYGTAGSITQIALTFGVGHTTDGACAFTGDYTPNYWAKPYVSSGAADYTLCSFSCDEEHLSMALFLGLVQDVAASRFGLILGVDRLRNDTGSALTTGCNIVTVGMNTFTQAILPASGAQFPSTPLAEPMILGIPAGGMSSYQEHNLISYLYPYLGCAGNPDMNFIFYGLGANLTPGGTIWVLDMYGVEHTYLLTAVGGTINSDLKWGIGVRYE